MTPERTDQVFAALGDPTRRALIERLAEGPASATELAAPLPISRQAVGKHLGILADAGLVASRREGRTRRFLLHPAPLDDAVGWMVRVGAAWDRRLARLHALLQEEERPG